MKLLYILPGDTKIGIGAEEMARRGRILQEMASEGVTIDIIDNPTGPASIECAYDEFQASLGTIDAAVQAEKDGYDGVIIGCAGDVALDGVREMVNIPAMGPAQASYMAAAMLGRKFSVITPLSTLIGPLEELAEKYGLKDKLASVRATDITVLDINRDPDAAMRRTTEEAIKASDEDGADAVVLGCMSMAFAQADKEITEKIGIPCVNPLPVSVYFLESLVKSGLTPSKKAYPYPPKLNK